MSRSGPLFHARFLDAGAASYRRILAGNFNRRSGEIFGGEAPPAGSKGSELAVDSFSLNFAKIGVEYKEQTSDGSAGPGTEGGFDLAKLQSGK